MVPKVEKVAESFKLGEGPHWDSTTQSLYFIDFFGQSINKYVPATKRLTTGRIEKNVSIIIPVEGQNDQFVIAIERQLVLIKWNGESETVSFLETLFEVDKDTENKINDGKCDSTGRLWAGTYYMDDKIEFEDGNGSLYSFHNKKITKHLTHIGISNGLAFDDNSKKFYYIDTLSGTLDQYDFDVTNGTISNGKPIFALNPKRGLSEFKQGLDGMTIDIDGNLWLAVFNGSRVLKIDPQNPNVIQESVQIPAKQITSVTFGGANLDELYVTTGKTPFFGETPSGPNDGALFKITGLSTRGLPGIRVVL